MNDKKPLAQAFTITACSEDSLLLTWPEKISLSQHQKILQLQAAIEHKLSKVLIDTVASYHCLMIYYRFDKITMLALQNAIQAMTYTLVERESNSPQNERIHTQCVNIPVYYDIDNNWDLHDVAHQCQLSIEQVIRLHSEKIYHAYALGFTPGFCYLANLAPPLHLPRKATPRTSVPKGAVAIAEQQTAVYPNTSPGGWHIIGRSPIAMYQQVSGKFVPTIKVGQTVKFHAISKTDYQQLALAEQRNGKSVKNQQELADE